MRWMLVLLLGVGCDFMDEAARRPGELKAKAAAAQERSVEEKILRAHFNSDFAQKKIGHLELSNLGDFEAVMQPRPKLSDIVQSFGAPYSTEARDLSPYGVRQQAYVYWYGRLGLATRTSGADAPVFWVIIANSSE